VTRPAASPTQAASPTRLAAGWVLLIALLLGLLGGAAAGAVSLL
jgi:H+/gluconate symporter-like permease